MPSKAVGREVEVVTGEMAEDAVMNLMAAEDADELGLAETPGATETETE